MSCYVTAFIHSTAQERKDQDSIRFCATFLWKIIEVDMIRLPRKTFSLTTVPSQKLKDKYTNAPGSHKTLDQHSPLMQWRVIEQLTLDLTAATQQINSGFGVAAVRSGVRLTN